MEIIGVETLTTTNWYFTQACRRDTHVLSILREHYADFGPTLAAEKLNARHKIILAKETVRRIQIAAGLWLPRKLRPPRIQQPRMRRSCIGELIQIDGCEHRWFEERGRHARCWCTSTMPPVA